MIEGLPGEVIAVYDQFIHHLTMGELDAARQLAPGVQIETTGWPYEDETGPLNIQAFQGIQSDPRYHHLMHWQQTGPNQYELRSGIATFTLEKLGERYRVTRAGLKPID